MNNQAMEDQLKNFFGYGIAFVLVLLLLNYVLGAASRKGSKLHKKMLI